MSLYQRGLNKLNALVFSDTLERLRLTTDVSSQEWYDILQLSWFEYQQLKLGILVPSEKLTERIAENFRVKTADLLSGQIDFQALALHFDINNKPLPERYSQAAYGRKRTAITSIHFLEKHMGWRLRLDAIRRFSVSESQLLDPFAPISMRFITDLCDYLHKRQFQKSDFFAMGAFAFEGNQQSVVAQLLSGMPNIEEAYEFFLYECMKLFEQNCIYTITQIGQNSLTIEYITNYHVAAESGVRHLGSTHICQLKCGVVAGIPRYLGLPSSQVKEVACVHHGDDICRLEVDFSKAKKNQYILNTLGC